MVNFHSVQWGWIPYLRKKTKKQNKNKVPQTVVAYCRYRQNNTTPALCSGTSSGKTPRISNK